jgi:hypothetical protein
MTTETKHKRRRSYFGPIFLITIGLVFLAQNLGFIPGEGWETILKLWPVLLIVAGLDDLIRGEGIAWPILLIGAGTFLLLNNFGPQSWISWTQLFQLWPIFLIAIGVDLMVKGQSGWITAAGIVLTIALIGGAIWIASAGYKISAEYVDIRESYDLVVEDADIDVSLSLGELILSVESQDGILIAGSITPSTKKENLVETGDRISYRLENNKSVFYPHSARWELGITDELNLELKVNNGVGEMFLDLEELNLYSLDANQGVGRLVIRLPKAADEEIIIDQAIGTIHIQIPANVRVTVDAQNGLSRVDFPPDFELRNGLYSSPGANRSNAELFITVEQAIGYIKFQYAR